MCTIGVICEYNPFHLGHQKQLRMIREKYGQDSTIVCLMSGNYVQRGAPAIFDKSIRAKAAVICGADLVLELPIGVALSSAEGFASGGVEILSQCCDVLSFGTETMNANDLFQAADVLLSEDFTHELKEALSSGCSFPSARQTALQNLGVTTDLRNPNDILGVEYCKAIRATGAAMEIYPVNRDGDYHSDSVNTDAPSATAVRKRIVNGDKWNDAVPASVVSLFENAAVHTMEAGERAVLARLRTMKDEDFAALPYGSEGLWRKLMKASRKEATLEAIINATKSKRYTRTRIDRMILCAFLGLTDKQIGAVGDCVRILAFNERGRAVLRNQPLFKNAGEEVNETEQRMNDLYGLFCIGAPGAPGMELSRRIFYRRENI